MEQPAMQVTLWGTRGSIPSPGPGTVRYGGNTSCVEVQAGDELIVLDAGTGIRVLGADFLRRFGDEPVRASLLISHTHWDHIQGLPFFQPGFIEGNEFTIYGSRSVDSRLEHILMGQMDPAYFPVPFDRLSACINLVELDGGAFSIGEVHVETMFLNHPGATCAYRLNWRGKSVVYASDNEPYRGFTLGDLGIKTKHRLENGSPLEEDLDQQIIDFCHEADLLIYDSQYTSEEYLRHVGWGHSCVDDAVAVAARAQVRRYVLFHHDPQHDDEQIDSMLQHCKKQAAQLGADLECLGGAEGLVIEL